MELLKGEALQRKLDKQLANMAKSQNISVEELKAKFKKKMEEDKNLVKSPKPPSPLLLKLYTYSIVGGDYIRNSVALVYNYTLGFIAPAIKYSWREAPIDSLYLHQKLFHAHGHQLFTNGCFNGKTILHFSHHSLYITYRT